MKILKTFNRKCFTSKYGLGALGDMPFGSQKRSRRDMDARTFGEMMFDIVPNIKNIVPEAVSPAFVISITDKGLVGRKMPNTDRLDWSYMSVFEVKIIDIGNMAEGVDVEEG